MKRVQDYKFATSGSRTVSLTINSFILQDEPGDRAVTLEPGRPDQRERVVLDLLQLHHWGVWPN